MLQNVSRNLTTLLIEKHIIDDSLRAMCEYSLQIRILESVTALTILVVGSHFAGIFHTIVFGICLLLLRKRAGGYHASKAWVCFFLSILVVLVSLKIFVPYCSKLPLWALGIIYIICVSILIKYAPINHPAMKMNQEELQGNRKKMFEVVAGITVLILCLACVPRLRQISFLPFVSLAVGAFSVLIAKLLHQEVETTK